MASMLDSRPLTIESTFMVTSSMWPTKLYCVPGIETIVAWKPFPHTLLCLNVLTINLLPSDSQKFPSMLTKSVWTEFWFSPLLDSFTALWHLQRPTHLSSDKSMRTKWLHHPQTILYVFVVVVFKASIPTSAVLSSIQPEINHPCFSLLDR